MSERELRDPISRRDLLKAGLAGAAGLAALPALIAACDAAGATATPPAAATSLPTVQPTPTATPVLSGFLGRKLSGQLRLGQGRTESFRAGVVAADAAFERLTGLRPSLNTMDSALYQDQTRSYLGGAPDDLFTWFSGYRMRYYIEQGLILPIDEVWGEVKDQFTPGLAGAVTGDDGHAYGIPVDCYPWAFFYRKSVWAKHGYEVPATWDQLLALCERMKNDGLTPIAFGNQEGWPAYGPFDMLDLRLNGYQFHMDLLRGKAGWTDKRVTRVFNEWAKLVPYYTSKFLELGWQGACDTLIRGEAGAYYIGLFMTSYVASVDKGVLDDIDFFEFSYFGNEFDAERTVEAPVDIWAVASKSPTHDADMDNARAYLEFLAQGSTQLLMYDAEPGYVPAASDIDVPKLDRLGAKSWQLVERAQRITNYLDRDTNPNWAAGKLLGDFFARFLHGPPGDLSVLQGQIQRFWDVLGTYAEH